MHRRGRVFLSSGTFEQGILGWVVCQNGGDFEVVADLAKIEIGCPNFIQDYVWLWYIDTPICRLRASCIIDFAGQLRRLKEPPSWGVAGGNRQDRS